MFRIECLGRLVKEVELSFSKGKGLAIARFTIAINESKDKVVYHNFTAFGKAAEILANHGTKGKMIFIEDATIVNSSYEKNGEKVYTKDLVVKTFKFC